MAVLVPVVGGYGGHPVKREEHVMFGQMIATAGQVVAKDEDTDPGVSPTWDALPPGVKDFLRDIVGTAMNVGIVLAVLVLVIGAIVWGFGSLSNRPGVGSVGVKVVAISAAVAVICAGANALIGFFAGQGLTIFS
jgi:hypothetical protein